jgi:hypothetical protein
MTTSETRVTDQSGKKFFSENIFCSVYVLTASALLTAVTIGSSVFLYTYWKQVTPGMKDILFIGLFLFSSRCLITAIVLHKRMRATYFKGEHPDLPPDSPVHIGLDVAARAIVEDVVFTSLAAAILLFVSVMFSLYPPK